MMRCLVGIAVVICLLVGCQSAPKPAESEAVEKPKEKLIFAFQRQKDPAKLKDDADAVGQALSTELGVPVEVVVPTSYGATVQALISNRADVAYLSSLPYLLAKRETGVEILLVEERAGKTDYDSILVVAKDSPYQSLADLKGKRMAFTSPTSGSGYVFPFAHFVEQGLLEKGGKPDSFFGTAVFAGGYDKALASVLRGQADVAAVSDYTMEGPTADKYLPAEDRAKLRILARIPKVPTHLIAVRANLPADQKEKIRATLLNLAKAQPERLADVYGAATFVASNEDHVKEAELALERTGLDRSAVVEK